MPDQSNIHKCNTFFSEILQLLLYLPKNCPQIGDLSDLHSNLI